MFPGGSGIEHRGCSFVGVAANDVGVRAHTEPAVRENTSATVKACSSQWNWDFRPCRLQAVRNNLRRVGAPVPFEGQTIGRVFVKARPYHPHWSPCRALSCARPEVLRARPMRGSRK